MKNPILILFTLFLTISLHSQSSYQEVNGYIKSTTDNTPIPYAHVGIPALGMGVISNELGAFRLNIPSHVIEAKIEISHLGYESVNILLSELNLNDTLQILLKPDRFQLMEVVVTPGPDSARIILQNALARIKDNYPTTLYQMQAFYREKTMSKDEKRFTRLIETMVDIQDKGIKTHPHKIKVRAKQYRKSDELAEEVEDIDRNSIYNLLAIDPIRSHGHKESGRGLVYPLIQMLDSKQKDNESKLKRGEMEQETFDRIMANGNNKQLWVEELTSYNGQKVFHLKFRYSLFVIDLFIDEQDFGIYRIESALSFDQWLDRSQQKERNLEAYIENKKQIEKEAMDSEFRNKFTIHYQKLNGKYYPSFYEKNGISGHRKSNVRYLKRTWAFTQSFLMINAIQTNKKEMDRIKTWQKMKMDRNLFDHKAAYHADFWKKSNILLATPLEQSVIDDMECETSLEEQFISNAKKKK